MILTLVLHVAFDFMDGSLHLSAPVAARMILPALRARLVSAIGQATIAFAPVPRFWRTSTAPHIRWEPVTLGRFILAIEGALGKTAIQKMLPVQPGGVLVTNASTHSLEDWVRFCPGTPDGDGVRSFVYWYRPYVLEQPVA